jgi:formylglycine-generating enzyme required for sulfatase activity
MEEKPRYCNQCGAVMRAEARFCNRCGKEAPRRTPAEAAAAPGSELTDHPEPQPAVAPPEDRKPLGTPVVPEDSQAAVPFEAAGAAGSLDQAEAGLPVERMPVEGSIPGKARRKWLVLAAGVGALVLLIVLGGGGFLAYRLLITPEPTRAAANITPGPTPAATSATPAPTLQAATAEPAQLTLLPGVTAVAKVDGMAQVFIPKGAFRMGSTAAEIDAVLDGCPTCQRDWLSDETPEHIVYLDGYWMDLTEVTVGMYAACVKAGVCSAVEPAQSDKYQDYFTNPRFVQFPVVNVDWEQAGAYCKWAGRRLPTEAEWEMAARGAHGLIYPWGAQAPDASRAQFNADAPAAVGQLPSGASPYGLLDMAGNVWEWVQDRYQADYYTMSPGQDPGGPVEGEMRVLRGGSWAEKPERVYLLRTAARSKAQASTVSSMFGFRCAQSP